MNIVMWKTHITCCKHICKTRHTLYDLNFKTLYLFRQIIFVLLFKWLCTLYLSVWVIACLLALCNTCTKCYGFIHMISIMASSWLLKLCEIIYISNKIVFICYILCWRCLWDICHINLKNQIWYWFTEPWQLLRDRQLSFYQYLPLSQSTVSYYRPTNLSQRTHFQYVILIYGSYARQIFV